MQFQKFSSTDAFIAFDLDDAPAVGITRLARKVLRDGAVLLARDTTYAFASFGIQRGGGSAGINAEGDARDQAVAAFVDEAKPLVEGGRWCTDSGLGLSADDISDLYDLDSRPSELWSDGAADSLAASGAVAAAAGVLGNAAGSTASIVGNGPLKDALVEALGSAEIEVSGDSLEAEADVVFVAGKAGIIDHDAAAGIGARVIVPLTPAPLTARAHAVVTAAERVHVPSFLSTAAPLLAGFDSDGGDPADRIRTIVAELVESNSGLDGDLWMRAATRAEEFLAGWVQKIPTFRPLA